MRDGSGFICYGIAGSISALLYLQFTKVEVYMDEEFHVPQALKYCSGNFSHWDGKITTFPGLYLISAAAFNVARLVVAGLSNHSILCSLNFLRLLNVSLALVSPIFYRACRSKIEPAVQDSAIIAPLLFLYPINFFYSFLFYTDTASTLSIVVVYSIVLSQSRTVLSTAIGNESSDVKGMFLRTIDFSGQQLTLLLASGASLMVRQTNAVWLLFFAGTMMLKTLENKKECRDVHVASFEKLVEFFLQLLKNSPQLLLVTWPLLLPVFTFLVFVIVNKGIVLGDKENHRPVYHLAMPLHVCVIFTLMMAHSSFFMPMYTVFRTVLSSTNNFNIKKCNDLDINDTHDHGNNYDNSNDNDDDDNKNSSINSNENKNNGNDDENNNNNDNNNDNKNRKKNKSISITTEILPHQSSRSLQLDVYSLVRHLMGLLVVAYILQYHTLSHPFLLSDNRHYSFYIWSRILSKNYMRYLLSPLYYYSVHWTVNHFIEGRGFLWTLIFISGAVLSLVPTPLFEIRYFNPAIVIAMLSMSPLTRPSTDNVHPESTENDDENLTEKKERNICVHFGTAYYCNLYIIMSGFCIINLITIYVFLYKPFQRKDGSVARFMY